MNINKITSNYLRLTSVLEIQKAKSGHPGVCLGASEIFFSIYKQAFFSPNLPNLISRDRIVFSAGHSSALIYACLNLFGFDINVNDLKNFRQLNSKAPGHPEVNVTKGVDVSTGPLGQGIANAVGLAIAEEYLRNLFIKDEFSPIDNYTFCFCGDGCLMEGVAQEAISIAGNLGLKKLILIYDKNDITIEGKLSLTNNEDTKAKFLSQNWSVFEVENGNCVEEIEEAILKAKKSEKPSVIIAKTHIGFGSDLVDSNKVHGKPLDLTQIETLRKNLNYFVPDWEKPKEVEEYIRKINLEKKEKEKNYYEKLKNYQKKYPNEFKSFISLEKNFIIDFKELLKENIETLDKFDGREFTGKILNFLSNKAFNFIGGSADVSPSTKAKIEDSNYFNLGNRLGKNIPFGIREHAMGAICNGICLYAPSIRAFCSTFFSFENYMTPSIRMSALMNIPVLYIFSHDSIYSGEDGPTHQPTEQIATLRAMPDLYVFRPCGREEMCGALQYYCNNLNPVSIITARQETKLIQDDFGGTLMGGYILEEEDKTKKFDGTIIATGSEVCLACDVVKKLKELDNINLRVVSMPCVELFDEQDEIYKNQVLDNSKPIFCIEASTDNIWYKYASTNKMVFKLNSFGKSGKGEDVYNFFGFSVKNISQNIVSILRDYNLLH